MADPVVSSAVVARLAAAAAQEVRDVVGLHGGALGEVATYGQEGPVRGVRVQRAPLRVRLNTVMRFGAPLDEVADDVRRRVRAILHEQAPGWGDAAVDVHVADVRQEDGGAPHTAEASASGPGADASP